MSGLEAAASQSKIIGTPEKVLPPDANRIKCPIQHPDVPRDQDGKIWRPWMLSVPRPYPGLLAKGYPVEQPYPSIYDYSTNPGVIYY